MTPDAIQTAIGQRLAAMPDCPTVVWPKKTTPPPARPYLVMQIASRSDDDPTLAGDTPVSEGRAVIVCVADLGGFTTAADALAGRVRDHFLGQRRIGGVTVLRAQALAGYPTDTDWRVPVAVNWRA